MLLNEFFSKLKGGKGSGNHGHSGRPGKRGGSSSKGGSSLQPSPPPKSGGPSQENATLIYETGSRWEVAETLAKRIPGAKQATSVTGKPQDRLTISGIEKAYDSLKKEGWVVSTSKKNDTYKQWIPENGYAKRFLISQELPSGDLQVNIK